MTEARAHKSKGFFKSWGLNLIAIAFVIYLSWQAIGLVRFAGTFLGFFKKERSINALAEPEDPGALTHGISAVMRQYQQENRAIAGSATGYPVPVEQDSHADDGTQQLNLENAEVILREGHSFFENPGKELRAKEDALNIARSLAMDSQKRYTKEALEIAKLILTQNSEQTTTDPDSQAQNFAATEWALNLSLDLAGDARSALSALNEALSVQSNPALRQRLKDVFLQRYPAFQSELQN